MKLKKYDDETAYRIAMDHIYHAIGLLDGIGFCEQANAIREPLFELPFDKGDFHRIRRRTQRFRARARRLLKAAGWLNETRSEA